VKAPRVGLAGLSASDRRQLADDIERWLLDPVAFVLEVFAPGWEAAHPGHDFKLEKWHTIGLRALLGPNPRVAAQASKGVGKTAWLAWVGWWFLLCHQHSKGAACSITGANLKSGLWSELALWQGYSPLLQTLFEHKAERISARGEKLAKTWFLDSRTFQTDADPTKQNESMAGLHNDNVFILLDEVGAYPMGVFKAAQGIFTDVTATALMVVAGNCNDEDGPLGVIARDEPDRWTVIEINGDPDNPDRCARVDIEEARKEIALYGRDDPGVRVNFLGLFPKRGSNKLLGIDEVTEAMRRDAPKRNWIADPVIFGLDAAMHGDDSNVLSKRQGCMAWMRPEWIWRNLNPGPLADRIAVILNQPENKDYGALFVDVTGGWGQGVTLRLQDLGFRRVIAVDFGEAALDPQFYNRRAEMHFLMADWIKSVGCIPNDVLLRAELCAPGYEHAQKNGRSCRKVEPKVLIKARLGRSPDKSDSLGLTFAAPVYRRTRDDVTPLTQFSNETADGTPYNPYKAMRGGR